MSSFYEEINGVRVHYEKVGRGPKVLLLIPGLLGSSRSAFPKQLDGGLDQNLFTLIAIDLPGWGKSRPPERVYTFDVHRRDAATAGELMKRLGYSSYSILGWSYGSIVGLLVADTNPSCIEKFILLGGVSFVSRRTIQCLCAIRDVNDFDENSRRSLIGTYGKELAQTLWEREFNYWLKFPRDDENPLWDQRKEMRRLRCPALIVHGEDDILIAKSQGYIASEEIPDSRLVVYPKQGHSLHQTHADKFNQVITDFLMEPTRPSRRGDSNNIVLDPIQ